MPALVAAAGKQHQVAELPAAAVAQEPAAGLSWQRLLARAIRDPVELLRRLELPESVLPRDFVSQAQDAARTFPLLVPESYLARMKPGDVSDPLLRQVLPVGEELRLVSGFLPDAVEDAAFRRVPGMLHKYAGRALLLAAGHCAVHCRYCFRRHYPYSDEPGRLDDWEPAFRALEADPSIHEVLLSGGDPLMLSDQRLAAMMDRLAAIPHLRRLRLHTRLPIVLPGRVTGELIRLLSRTRLTMVIVVHANHSAELVADCAQSLQRLRQAGLLVLNQAVLLRGVNDSVETLADLSESLIALGVVPYYLHQLDRVAGAAHFDVPVEWGRRLMDELRQRLPGYAVPRYVQEVPGQPYKVLIDGQ